MEHVYSLSLWLFAIVHIDTLIVITAFCTDDRYRRIEVLLGHYIGFVIGLAVAVGGAVAAAEVLGEWTFALGIIPVAIGVWGLWHRRQPVSAGPVEVVSRPTARVGTVAVAGIGLSGENVAVFIPLFAGLSIDVVAVISMLFIVAAGGVFVLALGIARLLAGRELPRWIDRWLVPLVLIGFGTYVIVSGLVLA